MFNRMYLGILLILALGNLAAAQFDIGYFPQRRCCGVGIRCNNYAPYQCCEEPPSPSSLPYAVARSGSGQVGVLTWHDVSVVGGCAGVTGTDPLGTCYLNVPFETITVTPIPPYRPRRSIDGNLNTTRMADNTEEPTNTTMSPPHAVQKSRVAPAKGSKFDYVPTSCARLDAVVLDGYDYYIEVGVLNEAFVEDMLKLSSKEMIEKYKLKPYPGKEKRETSVGSVPPGCGP